MKKIYLPVLFLFFLTIVADSQTLFVENFNFPVRDSLDGIGGWDRSGSNTPYNVKVINPGLTYAGYLGNGIGNTAFLSNDPSGDVLLNRFGIFTSGKIYMSFLIRVDSLTASATPKYTTKN